MIIITYSHTIMFTQSTTLKASPKETLEISLPSCINYLIQNAWTYYIHKHPTNGGCKLLSVAF